MWRHLFLTVLVASLVASFGCRKAGGPATGSDAAVANAPAAEERITGPVVKVNGTAIDSAVFYQELEKITQGGARNIPADRIQKIRANILNRLIEEELLRQEVAKQQVSMTPEEITAEFDKYRARFKTEEQFNDYLKHGKTTVDDIKTRLGQNGAIAKLLTKAGNLTATEEDAKKTYESSLKMYTEPEQVHALHILIKVPENAPADQVDAARKKIGEAAAKVAAGADFAEVAKEMSEDAMSKEKGGDLGFFRRGVMVPKFEEAAFAMAAGQVSREPVRSPFGFHLIKVLEKKAERVKPFDEVKTQIQDSLMNRNLFKARRDMVEGLKKAAKIEKFIQD